MLPIGLAIIVVAVGMFHNPMSNHPLLLFFEHLAATILLVYGIVFLLSEILGMIE